MRDVWRLDISASEKMVLLALADAANDAGICWPSITGKRPLTAKTSLSERTIQNAIKSLCSKGHLSRQEQSYRGVIYTVHPRSSCTPANAAPVQNLQVYPAAAAPKPSVTINHKVLGSDGQGKRPVVAGSWHRLPEEWMPAALPSQLGSQRAAWPPGWEAGQLEQFRGWAANAADENGKGRKRDWNMAWHNWLRRNENEIGFRQRAGADQRPVLARHVGGRTALAEQLIQEAIDREA